MAQQQTAVAQEELNPFEIAKQQFDLAADYLELEDSMRRVLKNAKRQLTVSIPVKMDSGRVEVFEGYRVQHNIARGPAKGGIRYHPAVTPSRSPRSSAPTVTSRRQTSIRTSRRWPGSWTPSRWCAAIRSLAS